MGMIFRQLLMSLFLIGFIVHPGNANQFPSVPMRVSPTCLAQIDVILEDQFQDGINYDPISRSWWFEGIPTEKVRYDIRGDGIDLVRIRFLADGQPRAAWVTAGIQLMTGEYHTWGPWSDASDALEGLELGQTQVRVDVGEALGVDVDAGGGVDFSGCDSLMCRYAHWSELSSNYLSNRFITSNGTMAPGWYPWGYLVWRTTPQGRVNNCFRSPYPLDEIKQFKLRGILIR